MVWSVADSGDGRGIYWRVDMAMRWLNKKLKALTIQSTGWGCAGGGVRGHEGTSMGKGKMMFLAWRFDGGSRTGWQGAKL